MNTAAQSCWNCHYSQVGGSVFPCGCKWFLEHGKAGGVKDVPAALVDTGCKLWKAKTTEAPSAD